MINLWFVGKKEKMTQIYWTRLELFQSLGGNVVPEFLLKFLSVDVTVETNGVVTVFANQVCVDDSRRNKNQSECDDRVWKKILREIRFVCFLKFCIHATETMHSNGKRLILPIA